MQKSLSLVLLLVLSTTSLLGYAETIIGNGKETAVKREVLDFNQLSIQGTYQINLTAGQQQEVTITSDENILDKIITEVKDKTLFIYSMQGASLQLSKPIMVNITVPKIEGIMVSGSNQITANQIDGKRLEVESSGNQQFILNGKINELKLHAAGATKFDAENLIARKVDIKAEGSAEIKVYASNEIHTKTSGSIALQIFGDPKVVDTMMSGSWQINPKL